MFGNKKKRILETGISARAMITNVQDTGTTINDNPRVKLTLQVQPPGEQPFEATKKLLVSRIAIPRIGDSMWVRYDPADPGQVEFDDAKTDEVNAATSSTAVAGGLPFAGGSTVIDASNVPGLRDELQRAAADVRSGSPAAQAELQAAVLKAMGQGAPVTVGSGESAAAEDPLDRIKKLNDLRLAGALTDAEFQSQKAKILSG